MYKVTWKREYYLARDPFLWCLVSTWCEGNFNLDNVPCLRRKLPTMKGGKLPCDKEKNTRMVWKFDLKYSEITHHERW